MTYNIIYQDFSAYFSIQPYKTGWIYCLNESLYAPSLFAAPLSVFFGVFPFPSQSCTQKSFNHLMMLQFHQSETSWNKKYSYTYISFIPFTFVGWTSLNVLARKVFTILAESISQTMCSFSKFLSCISLHWKHLSVTRPNEVWNLFPRPHLGTWWLVTLGCFSDDFLLVDKAPQHLDVSSLWASSTGIGQRFRKWRIENLSTHLAT